MNARFTPGPWLVNPFRAQVDCATLDEYDEPLPVARMLWPTKYRGEAETEANARLIAAAPELLNLACQYLSDLRRPPTGESLDRRIEEARRVILKALGDA